MRILHVAHQQLRNYGYNRVSWAQKLFHGLIKNDHHVQTFSDRDVASFEAPLGIRDLGKRKSNKRLIQTAETFVPDLIIVGHCDIILNGTLEEIRKRLPKVVIAGCNNDPLFIPENAAKIAHRCEVVDAMFVSTGAPELERFKGKRATLHHMPNPVDPAIEVYDSSKQETLKHDLIFCSKAQDHTSRGKLVDSVYQAVKDQLDFYTPGSYKVPNLWGRDYDLLLGDSKMGLNLNRQEGGYWYSSARMAQMAGNGLLVFTHQDAQFKTLFPEETLVYFDNANDLTESILAFHSDNKKRMDWAANTRAFFHKEMNNTLFAQYIVETSLGLTHSHQYVWAKN